MNTNDQVPEKPMKDRAFYIIGGIALAAMLVLLGFSVSSTMHRLDAVEKGVGRWTVNPKTGETNFEYFIPKP